LITNHQRRSEKKEKLFSEKILQVWVQSRACRNEIIGFRGEFLRMRLTAAPKAGEANRLLGQILAKALGTSPSKVEIISGHKDRRKRVKVGGIDEASWEKLGKL